jgi:hypothetical protein
VLLWAEAEPTVELSAAAKVRPAAKTKPGVAVWTQILKAATSDYAFASDSKPANQKSSFTQVLKRNLDSLVVELLVVGAKLVAAIGGAMEKLAHHSNRGVRLTIELGGAPNVDCAIEVNVDDVVKELTYQQSWYGLVADAKHFGACAYRGDVVVAPANFVIETQASDACAVGVKLHTFSVR